MTYLVALASVALFTIAFYASGVLEVAKRATRVAGEAAATMGRKDLSEEEKEKQVQAAALKLFGGFFSISARLAIVLVAAAAPLWLGASLGWSTWEECSALLVSWQAIVAGTVLFGLGYALQKRGRAQ